RGPAETLARAEAPWPFRTGLSFQPRRPAVPHEETGDEQERASEVEAERDRALERAAEEEPEQRRADEDGADRAREEEHEAAGGREQHGSVGRAGRRRDRDLRGSPDLVGGERPALEREVTRRLVLSAE